jgi:putative transposase
MKYDPRKHHRRSIRLKDYAYSQMGAYFVTICTRGRECVLDDPIVEGIILDVWHTLPKWFPTIESDEFVVMPNHVHLIVWLLPPDEDRARADDRARASLAPTDVMVDVGASLADARDAEERTGTGAIGTGASPVPTDWVIPEPDVVKMQPTLGDVVGAFKSLVFTVYLDWIEAHDPDRRAKFWQRNYYEHIIRSEIELNAIRQYIIDNPAKWAQDRDNPIHIRPAIDTVAVYLREAGL